MKIYLLDRINSVLALCVLVMLVQLVACGNAGDNSGESAIKAESPKVSDAAVAILALESDPEYGEYLANECTSCHNPNAGADSTVPNIHGAEKQSLIENLLAYKSGQRDNTTMKGVADKLSNEDIAALATYLSSTGE